MSHLSHFVVSAETCLPFHPETPCLSCVDLFAFSARFLLLVPPVSRQLPRISHLPSFRWFVPVVCSKSGPLLAFHFYSLQWLLHLEQLLPFFVVLLPLLVVFDLITLLPVFSGKQRLSSVIFVVFLPLQQHEPLATQA